MMVVISNSSVISSISLSINIDVTGSKPEFGSSQKRYFGCKAIALAIATRFCIPPLISDGYRSKACGFMSTLVRQNSALSLASAESLSENITRGNITFSITLCESNSAEP